MITCTRRHEIDAGHALPDHRGKCHHLHGHRYGVEVTVATDRPMARLGASDDGMVVDFADLSSTMAAILDAYDHRFMLCGMDDRADAMADADSESIIVLPFAPTAENLATHWCFEIAQALPSWAQVESIVVWETPKCRVEYRP